MAEIRVLKDGEVQKSLHVNGQIVFGRNLGCDEVCAHASISREHVKVYRGAGDKILVQDLGSSHGTWLDGERLEPLKPTAVTSGAALQLGASTRKYIFSVPQATTAARKLSVLKDIGNSSIAPAPSPAKEKKKAARELPPADREKPCAALPAQSPASDKENGGAGPVKVEEAASPDANPLLASRWASPPPARPEPRGRGGSAPPGGPPARAGGGGAEDSDSSSESGAEAGEVPPRPDPPRAQSGHDTRAGLGRADVDRLEDMLRALSVVPRGGSVGGGGGGASAGRGARGGVERAGPGTLQYLLVVDTNVLLEEAGAVALEKLRGCQATRVVIPKTVVRELDGLKNKEDAVGVRARAALRMVEEAASECPAWLQLEGAAAPAPDPRGWRRGNNDDRIVGCALGLHYGRDTRHLRTVLLSGDCAARIKAQAEGVEAAEAAPFIDRIVSPYSDQFLWGPSSRAAAALPDAPRSAEREGRPRERGEGREAREGRGRERDPHGREGRREGRYREEERGRAGDREGDRGRRHDGAERERRGGRDRRHRRDEYRHY